MEGTSVPTWMGFWDVWRMDGTQVMCEGRESSQADRLETTALALFSSF